MGADATPAGEAGPPSSARGLRRLGLLVSLVLLAYFLWFAFTAVDMGRELHRLRDRPLVLAMLAVATSSPLVLLGSAWAWRQLLAALGERRALRPLFAIIATTQLAKYLPGNVAQHMGRVALSVAHGIAVAPLMLSLLLEGVLLVAVGAAVGTGLFALGAARDALVPWPLVAGVGAAAALGSVLIWRLLPWLRLVMSRQHPRWHLPAVRSPRPLFAAAAAYVACYLVLGAGLWVIAVAAGLPSPGFFRIAAAFAVAWLVGFLAPGLPAGLGAREGALLVLLRGTGSDELLLGVLVASRLASVVGDLFCYGLGLASATGLGEREG